jgi:hypothetical protein
MILLVHLLLGALIGQKIANPFLAVILAFLSHYFLDLFPHIEYNIDKISGKQWKLAKSQVISVLIDFFAGLSLILLFSNNSLITFVCAFFAILPDGLSALELFFKNNLLRRHNELHQEKIHFLKNKKFSMFWRISSQALAVIASLVLFII